MEWISKIIAMDHRTGTLPLPKKKKKENLENIQMCIYLIFKKPWGTHARYTKIMFLVSYCTVILELCKATMMTIRALTYGYMFLKDLSLRGRLQPENTK